MSNLTPITALGQTTPETACFGPLELRENAGLGLASLALRKGGVEPTPFGITLPAPGGWAQTKDTGAFWTGPGQWMIALQDRAEDDILPDLMATAPDCSITEQTDGWVAFDISAPDLTPFLERLVNVDLGQFGAGSATRTTIDHMGVYVIHRVAGQATILGMRSSASSLWHALTTVAARLTKETET
ncbi:MAG: sarcosine oxidase subunit gamma [Thalassovita sp.]